MTPIEFLEYSAIGAANLMLVLIFFSAASDLIVKLFRALIRVMYEERRRYLDGLETEAHDRLVRSENSKAFN